jgi:SH3 domain protein
MRSGTSTSNSIVRMLRSGQRVSVIEEDLETQYTLVETDDGKQGYVLSRFLMPQPAARQTLQELQQSYQQQQARIDSQSSQIDELTQALTQEQSDNRALKTTLRASEQELSRFAAQPRIRSISSSRTSTCKPWWSNCARKRRS